MSPKLSKPLSPGDVITEDMPIIHVIHDEYKDKYCDNCMKRSDQLKKCSKCLRMYYCSIECQKNDWKYHKNECKLYRHESIQTFLDSGFRYLLRLYLSVQNIPTFATKKYRLFDGSEVSLRDIEVNVNVFDVNEKREHLWEICNLFIQLGVKYDFQEVVHWLAFVTNVPAFQLKSHLKIGCIGRGLYMGYTTLRHSCQPNSAFIYNSRGLSKELRAMRPIEANEEITINVVPLYRNRADRQQALKSYSMVCECDKCVHHLDRRVDYERLIPSKQFPMNVFDTQLMANLLTDLDVVFGEYYPMKTMILMEIFRQLSICPSQLIHTISPSLPTHRHTIGSNHQICEMSPKLSKPLSPGDVITQDMPIIHALHSESKGKYCDNCFKRSDQLKRCTKCLHMYYCGKE
ncbi:unnamed protein product, partial [Medioppia subpectinata]